MSTLAEVIERNLQALVRDWPNLVQSRFAPGVHRRSELVDSLGEYLQGLIVALRQERVPQRCAEARHHHVRSAAARTSTIKYGAHKPIDVVVDARDGRAQLVVKDRGIGISADALPKIFEKFERAVPMRNYGGLGLGLYICAQVVRAHGGTIAVTSEPGAGSTFTAELPLTPAPAA